MTIFTSVVLAAVGLVIGSFFNAYVWRFVRSEKITAKHSMCVHCHHQLGSMDLVPFFSFLVLGGRCRYCHKAIPWHYPVVECGTAIILLLVASVFPIGWTFLFVALLAMFLELLFLLDARYSLLPDTVSLPGIVIALIVGFMVGHSFESLLIGGILGAGFFLLQYVLSRGRWIGNGDIRLGALMGFALGWRQTILALLLAYVSGAVVAMGLVLFHKKRWESTIAFGTFLAAATFVVLLYGVPLARWMSSMLLFPYFDPLA